MSDDFIRDLGARVGRLETDVSKVKEDLGSIRERLNHLPTKGDLWKGLAIGGITVIGLLWAGLVYLAKPWVETSMANFASQIQQTQSGVKKP